MKRKRNGSRLSDCSHPARLSRLSRTGQRPPSWEALPQSADEAATIDALATDTDLTPSTVRRVLTQIDVKRIGARRRGDPHRFFAFHSHQIPKVGEKQETKLQVIREEADDANDVARF